MSCNPWPYIDAYAGNNLVLRCDLLGPQSNDIPNVVWYRRVFSDSDSQPQRIYYSSNGKYKNPTSSGDVSNGFKRVNFTLFISNVTEEDVGCYWCEINVSARNCSIHLGQSSVFCLHEESAYRDRENCSILPVNSSVICATNTTCNGPPANWMGNPYLIVENHNTRSELLTQAPTPSLPVPTNIPQTSTSFYVQTTSIDSPSPLSSLQASQQLVASTPHSTQPIGSPNYQPTLGNSNILSIFMTATSSALPIIISLTSHQQSVTTSDNEPLHTLEPMIVSSSPPSKPQETSIIDHASVISHTPGSEDDSDGMIEFNSSPSAVQIGVYVGMTVCVVLLIIIVILTVGVVLLCKKSAPGKASRTGNHEGMLSKAIGCYCESTHQILMLTFLR